MEENWGHKTETVSTTLESPEGSERTTINHIDTLPVSIGVVTVSKTPHRTDCPGGPWTKIKLLSVVIQDSRRERNFNVLCYLNEHEKSEGTLDLTRHKIERDNTRFD